MLVAAWLALGPVVFHPARAEQLPVKNYTIADGLARDYINRIKQDSHGFIWFCTSEGLSRFDGYGFTNYGLADGLPHRVVNDFLETGGGAYLFATGGGLVEFNPSGPDANGSRFTPIALDQNEPSKNVTTLIEGEAGAIWCGTENGVYRLTKAAAGWQATWIRSTPAQEQAVPTVNTLAFDRQGGLWIGTLESGLYRRLPDSNVEHYTTQHGLPAGGISKLLLDRENRMWAGTGHGLALLVKDPRHDQRVVERFYSTKDGLLNHFISALWQSFDGRIWVGTRGGLHLLVEPAEGNGLSFRSYGTAHGLRNVNIRDISEDRDGNLWLGAESGGAMKIPRAGFTSYFEADGLGNGRIVQLFSDHGGQVYTIANATDSTAAVMARFDGHGWVRETPNLPPKTPLTWGWNHLIVQDRAGDWWLPTTRGIFRFSGRKSFSELAGSRPTKAYTPKDGLDGEAVFRLFEDARGDLWFSTIDAQFASVQRWERSSDKLYR